MKNLYYAISALAALGLGLSLGRHFRYQQPDSGSLDGLTRVAAVHSAVGVNVDSRIQQLLGIRTVVVEKHTGLRSPRLSGRVAVDQSRVYSLNVAADGLVKDTSDDGVGSYVKQNQRLAVIYSPQFLSVAGGYLSANQRTQGNKEGAPGTEGYASQQTWADRLRNLGMSDTQIKELASTRKVPEVVYINSPIDGFILARNISAGEKFEPYAEFYRIADLSQVWVLADVFPSEAAFFRPGMSATITLTGKEKSYKATVTNVLPEVNTATRALQLRLETDNKDFGLRPDMVVNVELKIAAPAGLSVPADAVLESGNSRRVFVERSDGSFESRAVETGERFRDRVEIVKGLAAGEKVVSSGAFLLEAESQLSSARTTKATRGPGEVSEASGVKRASAVTTRLRSSLE
jgi:RND family efflux transporter MFP subunit